MVGQDAPAPIVEPMAPVPTVEHDAPTATVEPSAPVPPVECDAPTPIIEPTLPVSMAEHDAPVSVVERDAPLPSQSPGSPPHVANSILPDSSHATNPVITGNTQSKSILGSAIADPALPGQNSIQTLGDPNAPDDKTTSKGSKRKPSQSKKPGKSTTTATRRSARGKRELDNMEDTNENVDADADADAEPGNGKEHGPPTKRRRVRA
jgi:hypothetical protein